MKQKVFTIPLLPTSFELDCVIGGTRKQLIKHLATTYGEPKAYYDGIIVGPFCGIVRVNGFDKVILCTTNDHIPVIAHEVVHATWKLDSLAGLNLDSRSQETQAYYVSYILIEILKNLR